MLPVVPAFAADAKKEAVNIVRQLADEKKEGAALPEWLSRVEMQGMFGLDNPEWSVLTVQPLWQSEGSEHTLFVQGSVLNYDQFGEERMTSNLGLGYRQLFLDKKLMLGVNSFYDREWTEEHERVGFGIEARSNPIEVNANYYEAISGAKTLSTTVTERALDGMDAELGVQVPFIPWAKIFARTYEWQGENASDTEGQVYSMRLQPTNWLELEAGHDDNHRLGGDNFVLVNFKFAFGAGNNETPKRWVDNKPFDFDQTMESKTLEKVRRENKIVVERTTTTGGGFTVTVSRGT